MAIFSRLAVLILPAFLTLVCGCANWRLPAIDPSGDRILLPAPQSTTFNTRQGYPQTPANPSRIGRALGIPGPLFPSAPRPEACPEGFIPPNKATADIQPQTASPAPEPSVPRVMVPGCFQDANGRPYRLCGEQTPPQGRVTLQPRRVIAPVGSEVVIVGGVCDRDGFYRTREDVEWALQKGSVGTFTEPGQVGYGIIGSGRFLGNLLSEPLPELMSNEYALGTTSRKVQVLTRGTPEPNDDIFVQNGQAWIGLTSAREGNSYVTMFAPNLDNQNDRKATAVVHWIDGRWTLPARKVASPGAPETLTTTVQRQLTGSPIPYWMVRYEITGGAPASFEGGSQVREVQTDSLGQATVKVLPQGAVSGTTQIKVQVIRPASGRGEPDRMIIGQGFTSISWNNSNLEVRLDGPADNIRLEGEADYQITVRNTGTITESGIEIRSMIPAGMELVSTSPQAQQLGATVIWNLGQLGPGQEQSVNVIYRATQSGTIRHCVTAQSDRVAPIEDCTSTFVNVRALKIDIEGPAETARLEIGQIANYDVIITNQGDRRLTDILVSDRFDEGLRFRTADASDPEKPSPISRSIASLEPGETNRFELNFVVTAPGRHCHTIEASANGTESATVVACVQGVEPARTSLQVQATGPAQMTVGQRQVFSILLRNTGDIPISNLRVTCEYDNSLRPTGSSPQAIVGENFASPVTWQLQQTIRPGDEPMTLRLQFEALTDVNSTTVQVVVQGPDGIAESDSFSLSILPNPEKRDPIESAAEPDPVQPNERDDLNPPNGNAIDNRWGAEEENFVNLGLSIEGRRDRIVSGRGSETYIDYLFLVRNDDDVFESNVQLRVSLPKEVQFINFRGPYEDATFSSDRRVIQMRPIETIRNGETIRYEVRVRLLQPGEIVVQGELTSLRNPTPIVKENRMVVRN